MMHYQAMLRFEPANFAALNNIEIV
jgi:hypothetical protein